MLDLYFPIYLDDVLYYIQEDVAFTYKIPCCPSLHET